jgi:hypothetical protein
VNRRLQRESRRRLVAIMERAVDALRDLEGDVVSEDQIREGIAALEALPPHLRGRHAEVLRGLRAALGVSDAES